MAEEVANTGITRLRNVHGGYKNSRECLLYGQSRPAQQYFIEYSGDRTGENEYRVLVILGCFLGFWGSVAKAKFLAFFQFIEISSAVLVS